MSKCNFCFDNLDQGLPPACVAACPLRVLDYMETSAESAPATIEIRLWEAPPHIHPYPLPNYSRTQPRLAIKQHPAMNTAEKKFVANFEEIRPRIPSAWEDVPLILFTLLTQMAVGGFWAMQWTFPQTWALAERGMSLSQWLPTLLIGLYLGGGMLASFAHLGTKKRALFALRNLRRSWLSREVLFTGLFGLAWFFTTWASVIWRRGSIEAIALTATLGLGLVYSMAQVYRLKTVPGWNTWRTNAGFMVSALLLGQTVMAALLSDESKATDSIVLILLLGQLALNYKQVPQSLLHTIRMGFILLAVIVSTISLLTSNSDITWLNLLMALIIVIEEGMGRWLFFRIRI
jgi:DMSO reductase anchor subunit